MSQNQVTIPSFQIRLHSLRGDQQMELTVNMTHKWFMERCYEIWISRSLPLCEGRGSGLAGLRFYLKE